MLKIKLQNREGDVCCQPQSHSHQKKVWFFLVLFGVSLLIGITASPVALARFDAWNDAPEINNFESAPGYGDAWTFDGTVIDESPGGLTITFGRLLEGHSTTTDEDGEFSYTVVLTGFGLVTAQTEDELGQESNLAKTAVEEDF